MRTSSSGQCSRSRPRKARKSRRAKGSPPVRRQLFHAQGPRRAGQGDHLLVGQDVFVGQVFHVLLPGAAVETVQVAAVGNRQAQVADFAAVSIHKHGSTPCCCPGPAGRRDVGPGAPGGPCRGRGAPGSAGCLPQGCGAGRFRRQGRPARESTTIIRAGRRRWSCAPFRRVRVRGAPGGVVCAAGRQPLVGPPVPGWGAWGCSRSRRSRSAGKLMFRKASASWAAQGRSWRAGGMARASL